MGNNTTVTVGAIAGSLATMTWWILESYEVLPQDPPDAVVAASVVILTAILQMVIPGKEK